MTSKITKEKEKKEETGEKLILKFLTSEPPSTEDDKYIDRISPLISALYRTSEKSHLHLNPPMDALTKALDEFEKDVKFCAQNFDYDFLNDIDFFNFDIVDHEFQKLHSSLLDMFETVTFLINRYKDIFLTCTQRKLYIAHNEKDSKMKEKRIREIDEILAKERENVINHFEEYRKYFMKFVIKKFHVISGKLVYYFPKEK